MNNSIIYGIHSVEAALRHHTVTKLWVNNTSNNKQLDNIIKASKDQGVTIQDAARAELTALANATAHQGIVGEIKALMTGNEQTLAVLLAELAKPAFLLILDGVQDPHNLGACLRSAAAAGVDAVIAPKDRAAPLTPAARKVASGAADVVPLVSVTNLARTLKELKKRGVWTVGLAGEAATSLHATDLSGPLALIVGAEGSGLRRLTKKHCDFLAYIPMTDAVESLNVSVSAGIGLFEAVRQRA